MKITTVLFDFDGTIADTVNPVVEILNRLSSDYGEDKITPEKLEHYRNKRNQEALKETGISTYKIFFILRRVWKEIHKIIPELKCINGVKEALSDLKKSNLKLGIVTTGTKDNVIKFLDNNGLDMFDFVHDRKQMFGKKKALRKVIKKYNLNPGEVIYVGDQTSDIEAAKSVGIPIIAVGWGFNREGVLTEQEPEYFIKEPKELVKIMQAL